MLRLKYDKFTWISNIGDIQDISLTTHLRRNLMSEAPKQAQHIVVTATKSVAISLILTFLFGPLGMLYSTILGGVIMTVLVLIIGIFTLGFGLFILWPICMIWGALAVSGSNKKMLAQVAAPQA